MLTYLLSNSKSSVAVQGWPIATGTSSCASRLERYRLWASYQIRKIPGCACAGNAGNVFLRHRHQRKPLVSDPDMHHGTCVTHVPWCMSGSLTRGGGENVPGIPGACANLNFTYLARGPCQRGLFMIIETSQTITDYLLRKRKIQIHMHNYKVWSQQFNNNSWLNTSICTINCSFLSMWCQWYLS